MDISRKGRSRYGLPEFGTTLTDYLGSGSFTRASQAEDGLAWTRLYADLSSGSVEIYDANNRTYNASFSRSTSAWSNGEYVGSNIPRIYNTNSKAPSILLEGRSHNHMPYSNDFSMWSNFSSLVTVTSDAVDGPDTTEKADLLLSDKGQNNSRVYHFIEFNAPGNTITFSVWVKRYSGVGKIALQLVGYDAQDNIERPTLSGNAGGYTASAGIWETDIDASEGWKRVWVTATFPPESLVNRLLPMIFPTGYYHESETNGVYAFGAQLETSRYPTSYIPTTGTTPVERNFDDLSFPLMTKSWRKGTVFTAVKVTPNPQWIGTVVGVGGTRNWTSEVDWNTLVVLFGGNGGSSGTTTANIGVLATGVDPNIYLSQGNWHTLIASWEVDETSGTTLQFYIDGVLANSSGPSWTVYDNAPLFDSVYVGRLASNHPTQRYYGYMGLGAPKLGIPLFDTKVWTAQEIQTASDSWLTELNAGGELSWL